jgi:hypothetical protein
VNPEPDDGDQEREPGGEEPAALFAKAPVQLGLERGDLDVDSGFELGNFPGSNTLALSGAKVEFYVENSPVQTFFVPQGSGNAWAVFEWDGNSVRAVNQLLEISGVPQPALRAAGAGQPAWMTEMQTRLPSQSSKQP